MGAHPPSSDPSLPPSSDPSLPTPGDASVAERVFAQWHQKRNAPQLFEGVEAMLQRLKLAKWKVGEPLGGVFVTLRDLQGRLEIGEIWVGGRFMAEKKDGSSLGFLIYGGKKRWVKLFG